MSAGLWRINACTVESFVWGVFVPQRGTGQVGFVVEGAAGLTGGVIIEKSSLSHYGTLGKINKFWITSDKQVGGENPETK